MRYFEACIFCGEQKQPSDEHVFPAGLGGDDRRYILKEGVCRDCNNGFSGIEATFLRRSIVALARVIHQRENRDGRAPTFDPMESYISDEDGEAFEAGYVSGFNAEVYPQVTLIGEKTITSAPDRESLLVFLNRAKTLLLRDELVLIEKNRSNTRNKFVISRFRYQRNTFMFVVKEGAPKVPKGCIWVERTLNSKVNSDCRLYRRSGSQLVVKAKVESGIGMQLASIRHTLPLLLDQAERVEGQLLHQPLVTTTCLGWSPDCDRVIAKIGINFLAKEFGLEAARHPDLKPVKTFISGENHSFRTAFMDEDTKHEAFGYVPKGHHCVLVSHQISDGRSRSFISM